jgi:hypothetical protein
MNAVLILARAPQSQGDEELEEESAARAVELLRELLEEQSLTNAQMSAIKTNPVFDHLRARENFPNLGN